MDMRRLVVHTDEQITCVLLAAINNRGQWHSFGWILRPAVRIYSRNSPGAARLGFKRLQHDSTRRRHTPLRPEARVLAWHGEPSRAPQIAEHSHPSRARKSLLSGLSVSQGNAATRQRVHKLRQPSWSLRAPVIRLCRISSKELGICLNRSLRDFLELPNALWPFSS